MVKSPFSTGRGNLRMLRRSGRGLRTTSRALDTRNEARTTIGQALKYLINFDAFSASQSMWMLHLVVSATEPRKRIMANTDKSNPGTLSKDREKTTATEKKGGHASSEEAMRKIPSKAPDPSKKGGHPMPGGGRGQ